MIIKYNEYTSGRYSGLKTTEVSDTQLLNVLLSHKCGYEIVNDCIQLFNNTEILFSDVPVYDPLNCSTIKNGDRVIYLSPTYCNNIEYGLKLFEEYEVLDHYEDGSRGTRILINNGLTESYYNWELFGTQITKS